MPLPTDYVRSVAAVARECGLSLHVDGARIFNASVSLGEPVDAMCRGGWVRVRGREGDGLTRALIVVLIRTEVDSLTFCLSKGLGCPGGSVVLGTEPFIRECRRHRKVGDPLDQACDTPSACESGSGRGHAPVGTAGGHGAGGSG